MSLSPSQLGSKTSTSWLSRVRQRDPQAWRRLTELYGPLVYHWGRRHGLSAEDASDLTQEVFSAVVGAIERFLHSPEQGTFRGWLWTIARNKLRDHFGREADREAADGGTEACQRLAMIPEIWSDESHDAWSAVARHRPPFKNQTACLCQKTTNESCLHLESLDHEQNDRLEAGPQFVRLSILESALVLES